MGLLPKEPIVAIAAQSFRSGDAFRIRTGERRIGLRPAEERTKDAMAEDTSAKAGHPDMDYAEHEWTYGLFLKGAKYLIALVVLILIFLAYMWG